MTLRYSDFVDYSKLDPVKKLALEIFEPTLAYPERLGINIVPQTLGMAAVGFDFSGLGDTDFILTTNVEGLGTKNAIADEMYNAVFIEKERIADELDQKKLYRGLGRDTIAMSVNDQLSIGADVFAYSDIISCGASTWFSDDMERTKQLLLGYKDAADIGKFAIPQGETPELGDVIYPDTLDLAGSSVGLIRPKSRLVTGEKIKEGDIIYGLGSSGIHSNGLTKARKIAENLPDNYFTKLSNGRTLGEELLVPTRLYLREVMAMFEGGVDIHQLQPITGHGWQKIARLPQEFTYVIEEVPEPFPIFKELIEFGKQYGFDMADSENYRKWNMDVGFIVIAPEKYEDAIAKVEKRFIGAQFQRLGHVGKGERQVIMPFKEDGKQVIYKP